MDSPLPAPAAEEAGSQPATDGPMGLAAVPGSAFWVLFEHMSQEHGLTLLDSELSDICHAVDRMREKWKADEAKRRCRTCWGSGQVEIQSGPYYRTCDACGGSGQNVQADLPATVDSASRKDVIDG